MMNHLLVIFAVFWTIRPIQDLRNTTWESLLKMEIELIVSEHKSIYRHKKFWKHFCQTMQRILELFERYPEMYNRSAICAFDYSFLYRVSWCHFVLSCFNEASLKFILISIRWIRICLLEHLKLQYEKFMWGNLVNSYLGQSFLFDGSCGCEISWIHYIWLATKH